MTEEEGRNLIKIGILQESINLPLSDASKRAIKITEQKLRELGYLVVPFFLTDEVWQQARDFHMLLMANTYLKNLFTEAENECESLDD